MKIIFLGGDKRQLVIINELYTNHFVEVVGYNQIKLDDSIKKVNIKNLDISTYDVIVFPVNGVENNYLLHTAFNDEKIYLDPNILVNSKQNVLIFTGVRTKSLNDILNLSNREVVALMEDNDIKRENSIPTAEGIVGDLVYNTPNTINNANILVLGYGNIGKRVVEVLRVLGANVVVGIALESDLEYLKFRNIKAVYTTDEKQFGDTIKQSDIIVNTVPSLVLDRNYLDLVDKNTYVLDVSSFPYGVDADYSKEKGVKYKLFQGIPSVVAPNTAGLILSKKIKKIIGGEK